MRARALNSVAFLISDFQFSGVELSAIFACCAGVFSARGELTAVFVGGYGFGVRYISWLLHRFYHRLSPKGDYTK